MGHLMLTHDPSTFLSCDPMRSKKYWPFFNSVRPIRPEVLSWPLHIFLATPALKSYRRTCPIYTFIYMTALLHDDHDNDHTTNPQPLQLRSSALGLYTAGQDRESSTANNKPLAAAEPISIAPVLREKSADAQCRSYMLK